MSTQEHGMRRTLTVAIDVGGTFTDVTLVDRETGESWKAKTATTPPDFEKGFIRAQIYSLADMREFASEAAVKAAGRMRTEGRDYVMQEGDICHFLTNR